MSGTFFFELRNRLERAAAPDEIVVADDELLLPLYAYGSGGLQEDLRGETPVSSADTPVPAFKQTAPGAEMISVGHRDDPFKLKLKTAGYGFCEVEPQQPEAVRDRIYFVSPPASSSAAGDANTAVSSKP